MTHCAVHGCKTSTFNKVPGISLHPCPKTSEMRSKWLLLLKSKCPMLDWNTTAICSKHFENKYFDKQRKLKADAIPTMFPSSTRQPVKAYNQTTSKNKLERLLMKPTQTQLYSDIQNTTRKLKEPYNLVDFVKDDLQPIMDSPNEAKLWLLIKKQDNLISRLMSSAKNKVKYETPTKSVLTLKDENKELTKNVETYKYIVKSLQEKQATLEEQVEILTAVESR